MQQTNINPVEKAKQLLSAFNTVEGFHPRDQQMAMVDSLASGLQQGGQMMLEAPTGTGKTLAYLCAGLSLAQAEGKKLVIATGTINLQQQLLEKDVPWFNEITGTGAMYALAKGRARFACITRLQQLASDGAQAELDGLNVALLPTANSAQTAKDMLQRMQDQNWSGDLDEWQSPLDAGVAGLFASTKESCTGKNCTHYESCSYQEMRRRVMRADVVIANHGLMLSDMDLGGGKILPPMDTCLFVVDEAHGFPGTAVSHAAKQCNLQSLSEVLKLAGNLHVELDKALSLDDSNSSSTNVRDEVSVATERLQHLQHTLSRSHFVAAMLNGDNNLDVRVKQGQPITTFLAEQGEAMLPALESLQEIYQQYHEWINERMEQQSQDKKSRMGNWLYSLSLKLGAVLAGLSQVIEYWRLFLGDDPENEPATARWLSLTKGSDRSNTLVLHAAPSWAARYLREHLWDKAWGVVLVSATMRALGDFTYYRSLSGLDNKVQGAVFSSILDYSKQARLLIPWLETVPGNDTDYKYFSEVKSLLPALIEDHTGSLVLFSSKAAMRQVYNGLPSEFRGRVLMQGAGLNNAALLDVHKTRIGKGQGSVIFGVASFAEGVDLPGELCTHVVITRIPFLPFTHPVARNIRDWMGRAHFSRMSLPNASIRLIQACGRLLRNEDDKGQITILDRRLLLKDYGKTLLSHLPPYQRQVENSAMDMYAPEMQREGTGGVLIY